MLRLASWSSRASSCVLRCQSFSSSLPLPPLSPAQSLQRDKARTCSPTEPESEDSVGRVKARKSSTAQPKKERRKAQPRKLWQGELSEKSKDLEAPAKRSKAAGSKGRPKTTQIASKEAILSLSESLSDEQLQILERKLRSCTASTTGSVAEALDAYVATELIFKLERHGDGWAEEIFPHLTVEKRPLLSVKVPPSRNRGHRPDPWEKGSPEWFLRDQCCIPEDKVDAVMTTATAWRVTPGGRPLIDRRRRSRVARNVEVVAGFLERLGVPSGEEGVGKLFMKAPQLMLCKPTTNDRWDRRAVELAAYAFLHGTCNVPEEDEEVHELAVWVKRQRAMWQAGHLIQDRTQILFALGFEVGTEAMITPEWEYKFDQLVEWLLLMGNTKNSSKAGREWLGLDWGLRGGMQGRQCCIWVQLQRELKRRNLLPTDAIRRLNSLSFPWDVQGASSQEQTWMRQFGRLVFAVERAKKLHKVLSNASLRQQSAAHSESTDIPEADNSLLPEKQASGLLLGQQGSAAEENAWMQQDLMIEERQRISASMLGRCSCDKFWEFEQQEVTARRSALEKAKLDPGLGFWMARQQWRWRKGRLSAEQVFLLRLAGVEFDTYDLESWRKAAHASAALLLGSGLRMELRGAPDMSRKTPGSRPQHGTKKCANDIARPGNRLQIERWVLTQQALYAERRLSMAQIRYLALLELSWLLNRHQLASEYLLSGDRLPETLLQGVRHGSLPDAAVQHLPALHALGWLTAGQEAQLRAAGVELFPDRNAEDHEWDSRLTELLAFRREFGHCRVPAAGWPDAPALEPWLAEQRRQWRRNRLQTKRLAQLSALGVDRRSDASALMVDE